MINGDRIKQARELRGLTQAELAERIEINRGALTHYETGRYEPPDDVLDAIAQATEFPLAFFQQEMMIEFPLGSLLFRARASMTSKDKLKAHRYGQTQTRRDVRKRRRLTQGPRECGEDLPGARE